MQTHGRDIPWRWKGGEEGETKRRDRGRERGKEDERERKGEGGREKGEERERGRGKEGGKEREREREGARENLFLYTNNPKGKLKKQFH